MTAGRYKVDLSAHLADCEMNYLRLQKLLPEPVAAGQRLHFQLDSGEMEIEVLECAPYTTMLAVKLWRHPGNDWGLTRLQLRMYRDAGVAEVVGTATPKPLRPRYDYPNPAMHQRDEKAQLNRYLGEWLSRCLSHGHRLTELALPV